ncbi:MAG: hypothetical protein AAFX99_18470 [Myxococcota bacterium]
MAIVCALWAMVPQYAAADPCASYPGSSFFRFGSAWRGSGPKGSVIAGAFAPIHDGSVRVVGFAQKPLSEADIGIRGSVNASIRRVSASESAPRDHVEGGVAGLRYQCTASYSAQVAFVDSAILIANLKGTLVYGVPDKSDASLIACAQALGRITHRDGHTIQNRLRTIFAEKQYNIHVTLLGLPDYPTTQSILQSYQGAQCVKSLTLEQYTSSSSGGGAVINIRTGLVAERLLPHLRAAESRVTLTFRGSGFISGAWAEP